MEVGNRWSPALLFLVVVMFVVACGTARPLMPVPESLKSMSTVMPVEHRRAFFTKKPLRFGEWQVTEYKQEDFPSRTKTTYGGERVAYTRTRGSATYRFAMSANAVEQWNCRCRHFIHSSGVRVGPEDNRYTHKLTSDESLECDLRREGDGAVWKLRVIGSPALGGDDYTGMLSDGIRSISLRPSNEIENLGLLPGPPIGYFFEREGEEIASAELLVPGMVRISEEAGSDRDLIATAAAALLLQPKVY